jgi:hypothetical protein
MTNGWGECFCDWNECPRCNGKDEEDFKSESKMYQEKFESLKPLIFPDDNIEMMHGLISLGCEEEFLISCFNFYNRKGFISPKQVNVLRKICLDYFTDGEKIYHWPLWLRRI